MQLFVGGLTEMSSELARWIEELGQLDCVRVCITGGPCAGKTDVCRALKTLGGVWVAPEVATVLLSGGYPAPILDQGEEAKRRSMLAFQSAVYQVQTFLDPEVLARAQATGHKFAVYDRGAADSPGYLEWKPDTFFERFGTNQAEVFNRYDIVFFIDSVAVAQPSMYEELMSGNPSRYEDPQLAIRRNDCLRRAWEGHPRLVHVPNEKSFADVLNSVQKVILAIA